MTTLQISINTLQPSAMNMPGGIPLSRNDPATTFENAASTLLADPLTTESFSALLTQQISEIDSQPLNTPQISIVIDSHAATSNTDSTAKDANQTNDAANVSSDPTGLVSAVLLQIPVHPQDAPLKDSLLEKRIDLSATIKNIALHTPYQNAYTTSKDAQNKAVSTNPTNSKTAVPTRIPVRQTNASFNNAKLDQHNELSDVSNDPVTSQPALSNKQPKDNPAALILAIGETSSDTEQKNNKGSELGKINQQTKNNALQTLGEPARVDTALLPPTNDSPALISASDVFKNMVAVPDSTVQHQTTPSTIPSVALAQSIAAPSITPANPSLTNIPQAITARIGSSSWANEFSQTITWISTQQNQTAELQLNPPDLGPLNVVLKIIDNQLTAQFISPHSAVREAVENSLPKLRDILADNNIVLGNTTVSDQAPHDRSAWGFMDQSSNPEEQRKTSKHAIEPDKTSSTTTPIVPARRHNGILDTFA